MHASVRRSGAVSTFPLERMWRDTRLARLGGGADEVLADIVASGLDRPDPDAEQVLRGYLSADTPEKSANLNAMATGLAESSGPRTGWEW